MFSRLTARYPTTIASTIYLVVTALAYWPIWTGRVLLSNDQLTGYSFRAFAAEYTRQFGDVPGWYPHLFGGMPYLANTQHGDTFFPTALLRFLLPVDVGMAMGFVLFTLLAGIFTFVFLRGIGMSWAAAFVGGGAYMFSGQVISMASPGHDGKLFVSALLPLALYFLYRATAMRDWRQYVYFGVTVGFSLLSPHFQMTYYLLMAAGFFWLFMVFFSDQKAGAEPWWRSALLFVGALGVGFLIAAIQLVPFLDYLPWSPRGVAGSTSTGWEYATSWSMPPEEILNTVWPAFSGMLGDYWGRNSFKLHSEYSGAAVVLLALLSFRLAGHRRMAWFFVFLAAYGAIFAFGGHTPFYHIPYNVLPMIKSTRAVGMIYTLTTFSIAVLAAFGTHWLAARAALVVKASAKQRESLSERTIFGLPRPLAYGIGALGAFALLAAAGVWRPVMEALAGAESSVNAKGCGQRPDLCVDAAYISFVADSFRVLIFGAGVAALALPAVRRRWSAEIWALALGALVLLDLYSVERRYLSVAFSDRASVTLAPDDVVRTLAADTTVHRVFVLHESYMHNYLMVHGIRSTLGYNGSEIHRYDELLGGKNEWRNALNPATWPNLFALLGVKYVILDQQVQFPTLDPVGGALRTYSGGTAYLYRVRTENPYAFVVPNALRVAQDDAAVIPTLLDARFDPRRLLVVPGDAAAGRDSIPQLPAAVTNSVTVREDRAGRLELRLSSPATDSAFVFVAENYFPDWNATVDGRPATVVRSQVSLMAVAVPPGARSIVLEFDSDAYAIGRGITLLTVLGVIVLAIATAVLARRRAAPVPAISIALVAATAILACSESGTRESEAPNAAPRAATESEAPNATPQAATAAASDTLSGAQAAGSTCVVTAEGIGPVRVGMTLSEARQAFPSARFQRSTDGDGLALITVSVGDSALMTLFADEDDSSAPIDWTKRIMMMETFNARCATESGISPGTPVVDVEKILGTTTKIILSEIESRQYIEFERQPEGITFRLDYTGIFPNGARETTRYQPGGRIFSIAVSSF